MIKYFKHKIKQLLNKTDNKNHHTNHQQLNNIQNNPLELLYFKDIMLHIKQFDMQQLITIIQFDKFSFEFNNLKLKHLLYYFNKYNIYANKNSRGVYLYGSIGAGKTNIINQVFFNINTPKKIRLHFYDFINLIHSNNNDYQKLFNYKKYHIIFLDEFHISDIASAMILSKILEYFFKQNISLIVSSNYAPDELYKNGFLQERFTPARNLLKKYLQIISLNSALDYRTLSNQNILKQPNNDNHTNLLLDYFNQDKLYTICNDIQIQRNKCIKIFAILKQYLIDTKQINSLNKTLSLTRTTDKIEKTQQIEINQRHIRYLDKFENIIIFEFNELCKKHLSYMDYLQLSKLYKYFIIYDLYVLSIDNKDIARRFTLLIDVLYDSNCKLIIYSNSHIENLYIVGDFANEFLRTKSRLLEMTTIQYFFK